MAHILIAYLFYLSYHFLSSTIWRGTLWAEAMDGQGAPLAGSGIQFESILVLPILPYLLQGGIYHTPTYPTYPTLSSAYERGSLRIGKPPVGVVISPKLKSRSSL